MRIFSLLIIIINLAVSPALATNLIELSSAEGTKMLDRADKVDFLPLANHFESQQNKVFCGIASSVIVLNTLRLDNNSIKKPEDNSVLSKQDRRYFPKTLNPVYERYTQNALLNDKTKSRSEVLGKPVEIDGKKISDYGLQLKQLAALLSSYGLNVTTRVVNETIDDKTVRNELIQNLKTSSDYVLVNYTRKSLGQDGGGHISPLGAYDKKSDSFLVMDVNPNAAKWVWVNSADLIASMRTFDTVENRGYVLIKEGQN